MADITEDLLQTLAAGDPIAMLLVATTGKPVGRELRAIAAELREARADVERLRGEVDQIKADQCSLLRIIGDSFLHLHIPHSAMAFDGRNLTPHAEESARASEIYRTERDAARAEEERLRGMLALLCAAVEHSAPRYGVDEDWADIDTLHERMDEAKALLAKHKETP